MLFNVNEGVEFKGASALALQFGLNPDSTRIDRVRTTRAKKIAIRIHQSTYRVGFNPDSDGFYRVGFNPDSDGFYRVGFNPDSDGFDWISWGRGHS